MIKRRREKQRERYLAAGAGSMVPPELITSSLISALPKISKLGKNWKRENRGNCYLYREYSCVEHNASEKLSS